MCKEIIFFNDSNIYKVCLLDFLHQLFDKWRDDDD